MFSCKQGLAPFVQRAEVANNHLTNQVVWLPRSSRRMVQSCMNACGQVCRYVHKALKSAKKFNLDKSQSLYQSWNVSSLLSNGPDLYCSLQSIFLKQKLNNNKIKILMILINYKKNVLSGLQNVKLITFIIGINLTFLDLHIDKWQDWKFLSM